MLFDPEQPELACRKTHARVFATDSDATEGAAMPLRFCHPDSGVRRAYAVIVSRRIVRATPRGRAADSLKAAPTFFIR